ncbi:hypothetical protein C1E24_16295 [Pseudoalteromonas phenolica]|uniref:Uncharacterized protein n=1 Tax=Pseudoalteromonas phenolica TaxID=161398 RepID=A0A5R9PZN8_9GAMM|nr:hypothetical protein [Pseudoalteromonas phenolica]TLX45842.1 hypothetical protein C1E24_16295 [Pseudoalteromonas phenolica]
MYLIKHLLTLFFRISLILLLLWLIIRGYFWVVSAEPVALRSEDETRSTVHWLQQDKALTFNFSADRTYSIRVLSNAIFSEQQQFEEPVHYAIEYTLLDSKATPLSTHVYHHASKLALDNEQKQVKQIIENRDTLAVSSGQSFFISNEQLTNASAIALKLIPENNQLRGVVIRLHAKTPVSLNDINRAWLRQSTDWRERMTNYHTIGNNAISSQEILNAVTFEWQKLAPQGIPGIDFTGDTLYETLPYYVLSYDFSAAQLNLDSFYTDSQLSASFRNYQTQDLFVFKEQSDATLFATWYDIKQLKAPIQLNFTATDTPNTYRISSVEPGLIVVQSAKPILTRWFAENDAQFNALHSYFYNIGEHFNAEYQVAKGSDINFEFRGPKGTPVDITLHNNDIEIEQFRIFLQGETSNFDRIIDETTIRQPVFGSEQYYVRLPNTVDRIKISSPQSVLAKLQARQSSFHYQTELCEQLCKPELDDFAAIGAWFSQKAQNDFNFTDQKRITNVRLFEMPPPLPNNEDMATTYMSRDLIQALPLSNTFLVNSPDKYFADFFPKADPTEHQFKQVFTFEQLLLAKRNNQQRDKRLIEINKKAPFFKERALTHLTETQLLSFKGPEHTLFVNEGSERPWQKQRGYFLKAGQTLTLNYSNKPESVVIKVLKTKEFKDFVVLNTRIRGRFKDGLSPEYTIKNKRFALMPAQLTKVYALHPAIAQVIPYNSISLAINDDVQTLKSIAITAEQDIWISVLDELMQAPSEAQWRQYEND